MNGFERYQPIIMMWGASSALMALWFAVVVTLGGSPITPDLYGPQVYAIPAMVWCAIQFIGGMLTMIGASAERPGMAFAGCVILIAIFAAFGALASQAGEGTLTQSSAIVFGVAFSFRFAVDCWRAQ